ncbi:hypothetical protein PUN28_004559 [Cardiocondyla obscurior]|uniref:Uncharacterized protein n=1 Tax=Cardiocondyla obscurior TaxID=286306 RepID=A0AAW2GD94_9HYME
MQNKNISKIIKRYSLTFHLNVSCPDVSPICGTRVAGNRGTHVRHLLLRAHSLVCSLRWTHTRRARVCSTHMSCASPA